MASGAGGGAGALAFGALSLAAAAGLYMRSRARRRPRKAGDKVVLVTGGTGLVRSVVFIHALLPHAHMNTHTHA